MSRKETVNSDQVPPKLRGVLHAMNTVPTDYTELSFPLKAGLMNARVTIDAHHAEAGVKKTIH
jgi:hypothetical protein